MNEETNLQAGPITYKWQSSVDGTSFSDLADGPNSPTLNLSNISNTQDRLYYRIVASSGGLTIISDKAQLFVYPDINITQQPSNQTAFNYSATFTASIDISDEAISSYQWEYSTYANPGTFSEIPNSTGLSLVLNNLTEQDDGNFYRLKIISQFNDNYPKTVLSNPAQLDYVTAPIKILQQPQDLYLIDVSQPELFTVVVENDADMSYQWEESEDGINYTIIPDINNPILYGSAIDDLFNKNQYKYRVLISSSEYSVYSNSVTLHTSIELPITDNIFNNTYLWGDPHLRIQSVKGVLSNLDDNSSKDPIVYFYIKYPNGDSYKIVYEPRYATSSSTSGPTAIKDIWLVYNGQKLYGIGSSATQSTITPSTDTNLSQCTFAGVTGWNYLLGRCLSFSTTAGKENLANTNYAQLLRNSVKWLCKNKTNPSIMISSSDNTTQDNSLKNILSTITNKTINVVNLSTFNNSDNSLATTDVFILQNNYNWNTKTLSDTAQTAISSFVSKGGGLLTAEWVLWKMAIGQMKILQPVVPVMPTSIYTTKSPVRYIQNINDNILNSGVANDFTFSSANIAGTETAITRAKTGATIFYHSEQCIADSQEKIINVGDILSIIYKNQGLWSNAPYYNMYTKWNKTIRYSGELTIGGALYWVLKSLIEHKKDPNNTKYNMWKGVLTGSKIDGYGLVMKPYNITRAMLSSAVNASDGSLAMQQITENITIGNNFWKNLSKLLRGLQPNDKYYVKNILYFVKNPGNRLTTPNVKVSMDGRALSTSGDAVQYRWQASSNGTSFSNISDGTLYSGTSTNTLSINKPALIDNGKVFRLAVTSPGATTKYSRTAVLSVIPSIVVSTFPTEQKAINGKATFAISATSTDNNLRYQWQKSSNKTTGYTNIVGATSSSLTVDVTSYNQNNTYYRVILRNNSDTNTTNGVKLIVIPIVTIDLQPIDYTTATNTASFSVLARVQSPLSTPTPPTYQWQYSTNNRFYINLPQQNNTTLNLNNVVRANNNYYYRAIIKAGNTTILSNVAQLKILPTISTSNVLSSVTYTTISNIEYAIIQMEVKAQSTGGNLSYQWQQSKNQGATYSNVAGANTSQIIVRNIPKNSYQYYKYRVLISNSMETIIANQT